MSDSSPKVVIVGAGPVGMGLALELALHGVPSLLVERRTTPHRIPKGQNLTQRTMEHFQFWGLVDAVRAARVMPKNYVIGDLIAYRNLASPWWHATKGREVVNSYYSQTNERLPQYELERVMREAIARSPFVQTLCGWQAIELTQRDDGVGLVIVQAKTGQKRTVSADFAVGCDGARSFVRQTAGIERSETDFQTKMALVVFRSEDLNQKLDARFPERSTYTVLKPELHGYWQFFGRIDTQGGWFFHSPVPLDTDDRFDFSSLLREAAGMDFSCTIDHVGFWDLRVSVAQRYRDNRVFIAGDAAHTHPPYGGFGVNNGLEDAVNLGWKLSAVLEGWGGNALLDSYSLERQPVFRDTAEDFIAASIRNADSFLQRYSPDRNIKEFEAAWAAHYAGDGMRAFEYEPHYEGSPVILGPAGGKTGAHGRHMIKARAGHHLAPQSLSSGRSVFDVLGQNFTLLNFARSSDLATTFTAVAKALGVPLTVVHEPSEAACAAYETDMILVRPDQYVVWTRQEAAPSNIEYLLKKAAGH